MLLFLYSCVLTLSNLSDDTLNTIIECDLVKIPQTVMLGIPVAPNMVLFRYFAGMSGPDYFKVIHKTPVLGLGLFLFCLFFNLIQWISVSFLNFSTLLSVSTLFSNKGTLGKLGFEQQFRRAARYWM